MELYGKRILLVGMARSGIAAAELLQKHGATAVLNDRKKESDFGTDLDGLKAIGCEFRLGEDPVALLNEVDGLVISPGVPITAPVVVAAPACHMVHRQKIKERQEKETLTGRKEGRFREEGCRDQGLGG